MFLYFFFPTFILMPSIKDDRTVESLYLLNFARYNLPRQVVRTKR